MKISDEMLMAYADGELDRADAARVEAAIATDPALAAAVERHRALRTRLASQFAGVLDEPVPERLLASARGDAAATADTVVDIRDLATRRAPAPRRRWAWPEWGAMAASLLLGMLVVQVWHAREQDDGVLVAGADGLLRAHGPLAGALDAQLASAPDPAAEVAVGISFRAADGRYCRSFVMRREPARSGLACRDASGWQVPVLGEAAAGPGGELRLASTALSPAVRAEVDARIDGEPLDAEGERAARDAGWR